MMAWKCHYCARYSLSECDAIAHTESDEGGVEHNGETGSWSEVEISPDLLDFSLQRRGKGVGSGLAWCATLRPKLRLRDVLDQLHAVYEVFGPGDAPCQIVIRAGDVGAFYDDLLQDEQMRYLILGEAGPPVALVQKVLPKWCRLTIVQYGPTQNGVLGRHFSPWLRAPMPAHIRTPEGGIVPLLGES